MLDLQERLGQKFSYLVERNLTDDVFKANIVLCSPSQTEHNMILRLKARSFTKDIRISKLCQPTFLSGKISFHPNPSLLTVKMSQKSFLALFFCPGVTRRGS